MFGHEDQSQQPAAAPAATDGAVTNDQNLGGAPAVEDTAGEYIDSEMAALPVTGASPLGQPAEPAAGAGTSPVPVVAANTDELLDIKQQALQQLTPLVGHLEQNPEEKFRTTMMMIQASDNADLIKSAYEAALQITDEKVRAQALLDIVNEINYFTHSGENNAEA
jgi:hypothetical protein